ncbi:MAG: type I 3-dehydroquinate dehydratase [Acidobacteriota bacterium]|nr:type I 3-dehydroquinate dehydratase [Acidobacteriota bacterium]
MICVSLGLDSVSGCLKALEDIEFAEIRLDLMDVRPADIPALFSAGRRLIATCRPGKKNDGERKELLLECIRNGAAYVDIEDDAGDGYRTCLLRAAGRMGTRAIVSYHDFDAVPPRLDLENIIQKCLGYGADYVKIACRAPSPSDAARLLGLLGEPRMKDRLIVVGMGESGRIVRILAPFLGSPFTYASLSPGAETAPGQLSADTLAGIYERLEGALRR